MLLAFESKHAFVSNTLPTVELMSRKIANALETIEPGGHQPMGPFRSSIVGELIKNLQGLDMSTDIMFSSLTGGHWELCAV